MRASERAATATDSPNAAADRVSRRAVSYKSKRTRPDEQHAKTARLAIVLSLFLVLLIAALLVGGRALVDPLLQAAADAREARQVGDIFYTMPDGTFCRHLSFDNATAELSEGNIERCARDQSNHERGVRGFAWRVR